ncbi:MAG: hypothetical protein ACLUYV_05245 [Alistipes shahii]
MAYAYRMVDVVRSEADLQKYAWYVDTTPSAGTICTVPAPGRR